MKTITEYIQKKNISVIDKKEGYITVDKLEDGDYFVIEVIDGWKDLYKIPEITGKFMKCVKNTLIKSYFSMTFTGNDNKRSVYVHSDNGISGCKVRYANSEEIKFLKKIEYELQPYIDNITKDTKVGEYDINLNKLILIK